MGLISRVSSRTYRYVLLQYPKMDRGTTWMHNDGAATEEIDRDAYLCGKKVDKAFEQFLKQQMKEERIKRTTVEGEKEADIYNKRLEDPLAHMRKKEMSMKERLLANPVKMKMMRQVFEEMMTEKGIDFGQKKPKKERKRKVSSSSNDSIAPLKQIDKWRRSDNRVIKKFRGQTGTTKKWNQYERYRSSYLNRMVHQREKDGQG